MSTTVDDMILVSSSWAHILFDTGASHSFISTLFASILGLELETLNSVMSVGIPLEEIVNYIIVAILYVSRLVDDNFWLT